MRILFVSDTYYPHINGVYYFVCRVGPMLQNKGHQIAVIAPSPTTSSTLKKIDELDVYGLPSVSTVLYPLIRVPFPVLMQSRIRKIIAEFKPDIIHLQDHFAISKAVIAVNKSIGIPMVATNHFMPENISVLVKGNGLKTKVENWLWRQFTKVYNQVPLVTTPTETGVNIMRPHLKPAVKTIAISSGIDLGLFNPHGDVQPIIEKYEIPTDRPILLYVGRLDPEKRIDEILEAVSVAIKKVNFTFLIVGKGTKKQELEQKSVSLGIAQHVIFTGFVPDEDLPFMYKLSRCFIIASIAELLSLVTLQAMASGLPIIAVNAGALVELVDGNGYLYNEGDIPAIVNAITAICTDDNAYAQMRSVSLERIQKHDINATLSAFENLYITQAAL
ncbi:glycosyltransferase [Parasediminibacterium paludis]|uniref:Glycosyltransferase n=1 Tax=Parasediminibacterium paludis TaxID=908966 RepID=A0ABV8Q1Z7_9BACT